MCKSVYVTIAGWAYPLCLTVAAMDELDTAGYGINDICRLLTPAEGLTVEQVVKNAVWLLDILLREGEQNRHCLADAGDELNIVPSLEELCHILTPIEALKLRPALIDATMASISVAVEADKEAPGNGDGAARA